MCFHYIADRTVLEESASELFQALAQGVIKVGAIRKYAMSDVVQAHRDLGSRSTIGSSVLIP